MECSGCGAVFEYLEIKSDDFPICPECGCYGPSCKKIFSMTPNIRMDPDAILKSLPDPVPPLRELIGKQRAGTEGGFKELENEQRQLKEYTRKKDSQGNNVWLPKKKIHVDMGRKT